ncbi:MAG: AGE family epimerase/isomerase [Eubacteriales bacterium]|nr:AGE family epimerase/isomerase [Eubacteriales bacterium]
MEFVKEIEEHLRRKLIPFWERLRDEENGGFYGYMNYDLEISREYEKGCILNSRILWFFSNACLLYRGENNGEDRGDFQRTLLESAEHAYRFLRDHCVDREYGGVYWSVTCDGRPKDETKHTYNQAFAIYALSSYYAAAARKEALELAFRLQRLIQEKCTDEYGYLEAFTRDFRPESNEKLSENGVLAEKTMNTLLHVFEAYTELYRVTKDEQTGKYLRAMLDIFAEKIYNPALGRQEVFFDRTWNSLIDLYSYGHDIETAWLVDRGLEVLEDPEYADRMAPVTAAITENIYNRAYRDHSLLNEAENGVNDTTRIWWVQAEAVVGFLNGHEKNPSETKYMEAAGDIWAYIRDYMVDPREGSEWFWCVDECRRPIKKPIVEPWKCPYHNGRMCMEVIRRMKEK